MPSLLDQLAPFANAHGAAGMHEREGAAKQAHPHGVGTEHAQPQASGSSDEYELAQRDSSKRQRSTRHRAVLDDS